MNFTVRSNEVVAHVFRNGGVKIDKNFVKRFKYSIGTYPSQNYTVPLEGLGRYEGLIFTRQDVNELAKTFEQLVYFLMDQRKRGAPDFTTHMVTSFPSDFSPEEVREISKDFARMIFAPDKGPCFFCVGALHTNTEHPHFHIVDVRLSADGLDWLKISHRNEEINWDLLREYLADSCARHGRHDMVATTCLSRGVQPVRIFRGRTEQPELVAPATSRIFGRGIDLVAANDRQTMPPMASERRNGTTAEASSSVAWDDDFSRTRMPFNIDDHSDGDEDVNETPDPLEQVREEAARHRGAIRKADHTRRERLDRDEDRRKTPPQDLGSIEEGMSKGEKIRAKKAAKAAALALVRENGAAGIRQEPGSAVEKTTTPEHTRQPVQLELEVGVHPTRVDEDSVSGMALPVTPAQTGETRRKRKASEIADGVDRGRPGGGSKRQRASR